MSYWQVYYRYTKTTHIFIYFPILQFDFFIIYFAIYGLINRESYICIVLSPWRDPLPLHRAWCVYEAYCAIDTKCTCEIAISNASRIDILNNIENAKEIIKYLLSNIDVRKCKASEEKDVRFILKTIEKYQGGAERINKKVRRLMSGGYKSVGL